ncbi:hypothetical protein HMPREF1317_0287 [Schaalia georgiae F0490]|uniref:Endolysin-like domain-containing protein n=1 Tax=Schaalia georgiae F0490 TaxID=1125717 RepID=J1GSE3_9ACTO|nr:hypothetical protein [Schaalia georgiae]EJF35833.1 hypothetical protein HMPREF1317_0287 [Schaalia georgiae F0490]
MTLKNETLCTWARYATTSANIGYSQPNRRAIFNLTEMIPGAVAEADCSSLALWAALRAGLPTGNASYTGDMRHALEAVGWAVIPYAMTGGDADNLYPGDLLLSEAASGGVGHVAVNLSDGTVAEAWIDGQGDIMGSAGGDGPGDDTGGETRVIGFYSHPYTISGAWTHVLRPPAIDAADASAEPTPTPKGQTMLGITYTANEYGGVTAYVLLTESAGAYALDRVQAQVYNQVLPQGFVEVPEHHANMLIRECWERFNMVTSGVASGVRVDIDEATARVLAAVKEGANK